MVREEIAAGVKDLLFRINPAAILAIPPAKDPGRNKVPILTAAQDLGTLFRPGP